MKSTFTHIPRGKKNVAQTSTREWSAVEIERKTSKQHDLF